MVEPRPGGYSLYKKDGSINLAKFKNTLDYSLDSEKLREVYLKVYRNRKFSWFPTDYEHSVRVINLTFKYSVKEFNKISVSIRDPDEDKKKKKRKPRSKKEKLLAARDSKDISIYVRNGYMLDRAELTDGVLIKDGKLIAIQTGVNIPQEVAVSDDILEGIFVYKNGKYSVKSNKTIATVAQIRQEIYENGFDCDGIHYVRYKRSSGSSRVGKCLFIDEKLYPRMHKWEMMGIKVKEGDEVDLAALEAYIALTLSSIIDIIEIDPKSILVVDDYESVFKDDVVATSIENGWLYTDERNVEIKNSIWDGQSLIDISAMGEYSRYGMILLRTNFFKSCCFNTNIQQFFKDNNITSVDQLNGFTLAEDINEIKLITTPSSIKYLKFGKLKDWLTNIDGRFGVVKHEKKTHFFDGRMVQTHYQLLNTLQMTYEEVQKFLQPSLHYMDLLKTEPAVVRNHVHYPEDAEYDDTNIKNKNDIVFQMLGLNEKFTMTKWYRSFVDDMILAYKNNIRKGHVLVNGNYSTLLGNPYEMLLQSIGCFSGESLLGVGNIHSTRFPYGKRLLGSRSPHVCVGNVLLVNNVDSDILDRYFNLSPEIVCVNAINENILQRLSGADYDSDTMLLTDDKMLIAAAERNYHLFKVPTNMTESIKAKRFYTAQQQADLDIKTSVNLIGDIINLSQELQTYMWHMYNNEYSFDDIKELYFDICQLDVMSGIEIDKAKKEFSIDSKAELQKLKNKWLRKDSSGKTIKPFFFRHLADAKGFLNENTKSYVKHDSTMDYLMQVMDKYRAPTVKKEFLPILDVFDFPEYDLRKVDYGQIHTILDFINDYRRNVEKLFTDPDDPDVDKHETYMAYGADLVRNINKIMINQHTLFNLLKMLDKEESKSIRGYLITILFNIKNSAAFELVSSNAKPVDYLEETPNGEIQVYHYRYTKTKQNT